MRITRVYTRMGDEGNTRVVGGKEVTKDSLRIEAYGTIDELNSVVGMARATLRNASGKNSENAALDAQLKHIQNDLFDVGSDLATPPEARWENMHRVGSEDVSRLEEWIDAANQDLPPLQEFILPAGGTLCTTLHLARTVCRRAERRVVTLLGAEPDTGPESMVYLNRLSDLLFVFARLAASLNQEAECYWVKASER